MKEIITKISILFMCIVLFVLSGCNQSKCETKSSQKNTIETSESVIEVDNLSISNEDSDQIVFLENNNEPQVFIITGTASGIGKATAEKLIAQGHIVYGGDINEEGNKYLDEIGGYSLKMDVTKDEQVQDGINRIIEEQGRIDVLINNAGYGEFATIENIDIDSLKKQFDVNVFGYARLQQAVLPYMRKQRSGRIIVMSSALGRFSLPFLGWYSSTKHAIEGMVDALRLEVAPFNIFVIKIQPGPVKTNFFDTAVQNLENSNVPEDYKTQVDDFKVSMADKYDAAESTEETVNYVITAALTPKPKITYVSTSQGNYFIDLRNSLSEKEFYKTILNNKK